MITIDFSQKASAGLCEFLIESLKKMIVSQKLNPNEKLPSKRVLAEHLGVSIITVQNAYAQLIAEGYIYSIEKKGFFVTELKFPQKENSKSLNITAAPQENPSKEFLADFTSNSPAVEKFPFTLWSHTMRQILTSQDEKLLQRHSVKGVYELRQAISIHLNGFRNMNVCPEQIIIGAGTESLYSMIVQFLGRENIFAVENPGYHKVQEVFTLNGAKSIPINMDSCGINIGQLLESNANIVHVSPAHHFPTGIVMPVKRRQELLQWAYKKENRYIIEDDYDSEFRFNGKPLPTLQGTDSASKVIYMNTFSKTLSPSFRISYMVLPQSLISLFEKKLGFYSCQVSSFEQYTLAKFIQDGNYEKHINRMKNYYRSLRNEFITLLKKSKLSSIARINEENSGLHFLLTIKSNYSAQELKNRLLKSNINAALLSDYYYSKTSNEEKTFVINYSSLKKEQIPRVTEVFAYACGIQLVM